MDHETIFTVTNEDLGRLNPTGAILFFRELLWAEARRIGLAISKINVSTRTNVPDGGVDATVDDAQIETGSEIIKLGQTSYQIKSGDFKPWQEAEITEELFGKGQPVNKEHLGESIRACLDDNGTYVLVCTGIDLVASEHRDALNHIKDCLKQCGYSNPKVEVWSQNTLRGFLEMFPSLALSVTGRSSAKFQTHDSWARNANMQIPYVPGESQDKLIEKIRNDLRCEDNTAPVLVSGLPGIGKTQLVLEATRTEDLSPLVIYCPADQFLQDKFLMDELCNDDNPFYAVVVIDDCNLHSRSEVLDKLRHRSSKIKLITIYNNHEEVAGDITPYVPQPLENAQIRGIIQEYTNAATAEDDRWVALCSGSPRVAHVIGWNLQNGSRNVLTPLSTVNISERYIVSVDDPSTAQTEQHRRVLRYLALFKQFGFEMPVGDEAEAIAKKIEAADPQITWTIFQEIIDNLKKRKILQGEFTLAITPKALHIKLWTEWWDIYGRLFNLDKFIEGLTDKLVEWFYEMFQYAAESGVASRVVNDLLGPNGPFQKGDYLQTRLGSRFFSTLTDADPESALTCLERTIGTWDKETLLQFTRGRGNVIWALQKIAMWKDLFVGAAKLLLALGEAENQAYSNNAGGTFVELFSPGPGKVAPTEASPAERLPVLVEAFRSGSNKRRVLALRACNVALEVWHFVRIGSAEYQGLHQEPELWVPKTYGESWDAYRQVWQLLFEQLEYMPKDDREKGVAVLLGRAHSIGRIHNLGEMVVETVRTIAEKEYVNEKQLIESISQILFNDDSYGDNGLPIEIRQQLKRLKDELVGCDFHSRMQRYVGMDLLEDRYDEDRNYVDQAQPRIETLSQQAVDTPSLLQSELHWLVTIEAKKGHHFGYELGKRDDGFSLLPTLLDAQRNADEKSSFSFLGGYFRAIFEKDVSLWEEQLDALVDDPTLKDAIPDLTNRSGLTDQAGWRVLNLATSGIINNNHFEIFVYSKTIEGLSDEVFAKWIEFLMSANDKSAVSIALHLYHDYYIFDKPQPTLPPDLTFRLLSHPSLFEASNQYRFSTMSDYYWTEIGKSFLNRYPKKSLGLVVPMLSHFGERGVIVGVHSQTCSVLNEITKQHPTEVWNRVSKLLEDQTRSARVVDLERWLREGSTLVREGKEALALIPSKKIWGWIGEDEEERAWYFAYRLVPKTLSTEEWPTSLAREILVHYGKRKDVRDGLRLNYSTEGWYGLDSVHYQKNKQKLLHIKDEEDDVYVKRWIDEFVAGLEQEIKRAKIEEEREF